MIEGLAAGGSNRYGYSLLSRGVMCFHRRGPVTFDQDRSNHPRRRIAHAMVCAAPIEIATQPTPLPSAPPQSNQIRAAAADDHTTDPGASRRCQHRFFRRLPSKGTRGSPRPSGLDNGSVEEGRRSGEKPELLRRTKGGGCRRQPARRLAKMRARPAAPLGPPSTAPKTS